MSQRKKNSRLPSKKKIPASKSQTRSENTNVDATRRFAVQLEQKNATVLKEINEEKM